MTLYDIENGEECPVTIVKSYPLGNGDTLHNAVVRAATDDGATDDFTVNIYQVGDDEVNLFMMDWDDDFITPDELVAAEGDGNKWPLCEFWHSRNGRSAIWLDGHPTTL